MKSTGYSTKITYMKGCKNVCKNLRKENNRPSACLPACLTLTKKFSMWVCWKLFCCFWPIKLRNLLMWYCWLYFFPWISYGYPLDGSVKDNSILFHFCQLWKHVFFLFQSLDVRASENLSNSQVFQLDIL